MRLQQVADQLQTGESVTFRPKGNSMEPLIHSGQEVTLQPVANPTALVVGDIVLAKVAGRIYLHKITAVDVAQSRVQIGNNKGHINGWTSYNQVYGYGMSRHDH